MLVNVLLSGSGGLIDTRRVEVPDRPLPEGQTEYPPGTLPPTSLGVTKAVMSMIQGLPMGVGDAISVTVVLPRE